MEFVLEGSTCCYKCQSSLGKPRTDVNRKALERLTLCGGVDWIGHHYEPGARRVEREDCEDDCEDGAEQQAATAPPKSCTAGGVRHFHQSCLGRDPGLSFDSRTYAADKEGQPILKNLSHHLCEDCFVTAKSRFAPKIFLAERNQKGAKLFNIDFSIECPGDCSAHHLYFYVVHFTEASEISIVLLATELGRIRDQKLQHHYRGMCTKGQRRLDRLGGTAIIFHVTKAENLRVVRNQNAKLAILQDEDYSDNLDRVSKQFQELCSKREEDLERAENQNELQHSLAAERERNRELQAEVAELRARERVAGILTLRVHKCWKAV